MRRFLKSKTFGSSFRFTKAEGLRSLRVTVRFLLCFWLPPFADVALQHREPAVCALQEPVPVSAGGASKAPVAPAAAPAPEYPIGSDTDWDEDKFTFGKVVAIGAHSVVVREYDFARDCDVDVRYWITDETALSGVESLAGLAVGDGVVLDYLDVGGDRLVSTLVKEMEDPSEGLKGVYATIVAVEPGAVTVRQYNWGRDADVEARYIVTADTELRYVGSLGELAVGDEVEIDYVEVEGLAGATLLMKMFGGEGEGEGAATQEHGLPCVVTGISSGHIQISVTGGSMEGELSGACALDPDAVLLNFDSLDELRVGDRIDVVLDRIAGKRVVVGMARVEEPAAPAGLPTD